MKIILAFFTIIWGISLSAQSLQPTVIASAGGTGTLPNGTAIDWTLGETIITTVSNGNIILSQGFHQPNLEVSTSYENPAFAFEISVFPNPTRNILTIATESQSELHWRLSDLHGRALQKDRLAGNGQIDMGLYPNSIYFLHIFERGHLIKTLQIIKSD